ncbi:hypothetical protein PC119_g5585 [Phytophthora cactorum]|uniref:Uncharacterized protein n=1 Tax=Phytophthora cactorum TaxID=29920 RepID=A0A8T1D7G1_9STRA|nr:hypothetical protein PC113_g5963 [Phytophthora cactorum]KAG2934933.1 hypothetical protein PC115_g4977 [Phytophthora cactorum]KAG3032690.1 hypothetical protein PC119_g5585 [Phytophthora cactorum]KAG3079535.1 hypothetical protein PC121_g6948 [Phytophthora cactorum]KAG3181735.1 hypothetical protein C6341_g6302 [Phytophthora cactorum]
MLVLNELTIAAAVNARQHPEIGPKLSVSNRAVAVEILATSTKLTRTCSPR